MKIHYRRSALLDLEDIHRYITLDNRQAADAVVRRIGASIQRLELFPNSGRTGTLDGTFELVVPGLPYIVVYTILNEEIDIRAVYHAAQDRHE